MAVDLGGNVAGFGSDGYRWLAANAGAFGWENPDWARPGGSKPEPWHWEYTR
ncbi:M15 family metallopeptidase [Xylanimonas allomyrinae]|uniref:M15 family metallopeptidase n=1 Tax=Xylanimonas allomyrinae TaxID=2509459 RepID=UPI0013A68337|nr:M15 family metallopeptidase [Xylanimonas allomyrinae]